MSKSLNREYGLKKARALKLRKLNKSYNKIAKSLGVSKSTLAYWFKGISWSNDIRKRLTRKTQRIHRRRLIRLNIANKKKWDNLYKRAEKEAVIEFDLLKNNHLFIAGVAIYWGEGDRIFRNGLVRVSNTDHNMLRVFNKFLIDMCKANIIKIKGEILLYPDLNSELCLQFWSKNVNIAKNQFCKPTIIKGRHKKNKLSHGVCIVSCSDKYLKRKVLKWIELFPSHLNLAGVV